MHHERHLPGLDALRAAAILLVIPRHAIDILRWPWIKPFGRYGWVGVDLFFVLSGFLIGSQLFLAAQRDGRVNFPRFYLKRSLRILPAFLAVLLLYQVWPEFNEAKGIDPAWHFLLFFMNFTRATDGFSHAWSLCVEEHFYLILPALVSVYLWRAKLVPPAALIALVLGGSIALRYFLWSVGAPYYPAIYRPTITHVDGLTVGVGLALLKVYRPAIWERLLRYPWSLFGGGFALIVAGLWFFLDKEAAAGEVVTFTLISFGFGALVAAAQAPGFWLAERKIPGAATLAALAYTLYLTHKQMLHLAKTLVPHADDQQALTILVAVALIVLASLTLHWLVERPGLRLRDFMNNKL